jgi:hypothetical protein
MIYVLSMYDTVPNGALEVNTTSRSTNQFQALSPFKLGPCKLYDDYASLNMENAWQYSKVYASQVDDNNMPTDEYFEWAKTGWSKKWADRYPMGRGAKPLFSWWDGEPLDYIEARKKIYAPLYAERVVQTAAYKELELLHEGGQDIALRDFDGYMYNDLGNTLRDVLNNPKKKMGHAFVIAMLLTNDPALKECNL